MKKKKKKKKKKKEKKYMQVGGDMNEVEVDKGPTHTTSHHFHTFQEIRGRPSLAHTSSPLIHLFGFLSVTITG